MRAHWRRLLQGASLGLPLDRFYSGPIVVASLLHVLELGVAPVLWALYLSFLKVETVRLRERVLFIGFAIDGVLALTRGLNIAKRCLPILASDPDRGTMLV